MIMEERKNNINSSIMQNVVLENREKLSISGVNDVLSFDDQIVILETQLGLLTIKGENLRINKLSIDSEEVVIEGQDNSGIRIADDVVSVIAGVAVSEVPGVAGMAGGFAGGISEVLSGKKNLSKGIKVEVGEKETKIDVNIIVEYGTRIPDVAFEIQNRVKKAVETMTGLKVVAVNVHVQGVSTDVAEEEKQVQE